MAFSRVNSLHRIGPTKYWGLCLSIVLFALASCGKKEEEESKTKEQGMVGTSCETRPDVRDGSGFNVCRLPDANWPGLERGKFWFALPSALVARTTAVAKCKEANALDYGVQYGKSCFKACEEVTFCIPLTPNPDV